MSRQDKILRRTRHEKINPPFDSKRGSEGQVQARRNSQGEIELVAYFGGKWYYCPMAEFNKKLNLRHGAQVDSSDIMTATQKNSTGFTAVRINAGTTEIPSKLNECRIFVDTVPATGAITKNFVLTSNNKTITATANGANANIITGLNITGSKISDGTYVSGISNAGNPSDKMVIQMSRQPTAADTNIQLTFQTRDTSYPNAFLNVVYEDGDDVYYHKFQLNSTTVSPFSPHPDSDQVSKSGSVAGAGGSGTNKGLL